MQRRNPGTHPATGSQVPRHCQVLQSPLPCSGWVPKRLLCPGDVGPSRAPLAAKPRGPGAPLCVLPLPVTRHPAGQGCPGVPSCWRLPSCSPGAGHFASCHFPCPHWGPELSFQKHMEERLVTMALCGDGKHSTPALLCWRDLRLHCLSSLRSQLTSSHPGLALARSLAPKMGTATLPARFCPHRAWHRVALERMVLSPVTAHGSEEGTCSGFSRV